MSGITQKEDPDRRHIVEKVREPEECKHYPLCKHLQTRVREIPTVLLLIAMQIEAESVCCECDDFEPNKGSKMT